MKALFAVMILPLAALGADNCAGSRDLRLVNGKIVTMDARNSMRVRRSRSRTADSIFRAENSAPAPRPLICTVGRPCPA